MDLPLRNAHTGYKILDASFVITLWQAETPALLGFASGILHSTSGFLLYAKFSVPFQIRNPQLPLLHYSITPLLQYSITPTLQTIILLSPNL